MDFIHGGNAAAQGLTPPAWRAGVTAMMTLFRFPALYRVTAALGRPLLGWLSRHPALLAKLPLLSGWGAGRHLPVPQGTAKPLRKAHDPAYHRFRSSLSFSKGAP